MTPSAREACGSGRAERAVPRPLVWTMAIQAVRLAIIGFVPASVPHSYVTVPISFLAAGAFGVYGTLILAFAAGALTGAIASRAWGVPAIWRPAGFLAVTLCLFIIDERHLR